MRIICPSALVPFRGRGRCDFCRKFVQRREPHHILAAQRSSGGRVDHPYNLLSSCSAMSGGNDCHRRYHDGNLKYGGKPMKAADCFRIVAAREQVPAYDLEHAVTYFRNLSPKLNESDLKLRLAHLRPDDGAAGCCAAGG